MPGLGLNDAYIREMLAHPDQYVDNRTTMPMEYEVGSRVGDEYDARLAEPGLVDNSYLIGALGAGAGRGIAGQVARGMAGRAAGSGMMENGFLNEAAQADVALENAARQRWLQSAEGQQFMRQKQLEDLERRWAQEKARRGGRMTEGEYNAMPTQVSGIPNTRVPRVGGDVPVDVYR